MSQPAVTPTLTAVPVEESRTTFRPYLVPDEVDVAGAVAQAWIDYKREACPARREQLILHYAPLVAAVASRVAAQVHDVTVPSTEPRLASVEGVDVRSLNRAVWMLDAALVADAASRRWPLPDAAPEQE